MQKHSMGYALIMLAGFIDMLIRKHLLGFKLSTDQKGFIR